MSVEAQIEEALRETFRCERLRLRLAPSSCAAAWRTARHGDPCFGCPIGAANAGEEPVPRHRTIAGASEYLEATRAAVVELGCATAAQVTRHAGLKFRMQAHRALQQLAIMGEIELAPAGQGAYRPVGSSAHGPRPDIDHAGAERRQAELLRWWEATTQARTRMQATDYLRQKQPETSRQLVRAAVEALHRRGFLRKVGRATFCASRPRAAGQLVLLAAQPDPASHWARPRRRA